MMHGLINRAIQCYYRDTYGRAAWMEVVRKLELPSAEFEPMLHYPSGTSQRVIDAIAEIQDKTPDVVLEDLGTYLVSHPNVEALRRLLRFGGVTFIDFLHSLDELAGRARLAVEDLDLPDMELTEHGKGHYSIAITGEYSGFGHVMVGVMRAMADDYGALVFLEHRGTVDGQEVLDVTLFEAEFSEGRAFELGVGA